MSPNTQNAVILLAGTGSRLEPLTKTTHKSLIEVGGLTILDRQIDQFTEHGIKNFHLVVGYKKEEVQQHVLNKKKAGAEFRFCINPLYEETNTAYSLMLALKGLEGSFILIDGDVVLDHPLAGTLCAATKENILLADTNRDALNHEAVKFMVNDINEITKIGKAIPLSEAAGESIGVGLYQKDWACVLRDYLETAMKEKNNWHWYYEDAIQNIMQKQCAPSPLKIQPVNDLRWVEIDDHADLKKARAIFA
ncbi:MAG: phosphocholine cytidylyltransferase family protein [Deltaproteobacteria bacterium]|nr:phosphocholine cytidylyltransferase family protein [Deltaproteobacteria bacterium]